MNVRQYFVIGGFDQLIQLLTQELAQEAYKGVAPYREENYNKIKTLYGSYQQTTNLFCPRRQEDERKSYDYGVLTMDRTQYQSIFIDLSVIRMSRICSIGFLSGNINNLVRNKDLASDGVVYLMIDPQHQKELQCLFKEYGFRQHHQIGLLILDSRINEIGFEHFQSIETLNFE